MVKLYDKLFPKEQAQKDFIIYTNQQQQSDMISDTTQGYHDYVEKTT